jgi:hypothetical protein
VSAATCSPSAIRCALWRIASRSGGESMVKRRSSGGQAAVKRW